MKKIKLILFTVLIGLFLSSCVSDINEVAMSSDPTEPVMENFTIGNFNADNAESLIPFSWTKADFGFNASVNYAIQIDKAGNNFANAKDLVSTYSNNVSVSVKDINKKLLDLELEPETLANLEFRVKAVVDDNVDPAISNTISASITPYQTEFDPIYMIGAALNGWDLAFAVEVPGIAKGIYVTTAKFTKGGNFRFFPQPQWSPSWGYDYFTGTVSDLLSQATADSDPNYKFEGGTGNYKITINFNDRSIALELVGDVEPEKPEDYLFGIIGTAFEVDGVQANWDSDVTFTFASNEGDVYTYSISKVTLLTNGEFKIRKDKEWVVSYGYSDVTIEGDPSNFSDAGGNIKVTAEKTYAIDFILDVANNTRKLVFTERGEYPPQVFLVGTVNGWDNNGLYMAALANDVHVAYQYLDSSSEFKVLIQRGSWDGAWGTGTNAGEIADGGNNIVVSTLSSFSSAGFYEIRVDFQNGTVVLAPVTIGVIGDAQAGGWDTDTDLTYNETSKMWEGQVTFLATGEYKFRANNEWAINFGGALDNLVHDGGNVATPGAGTYNVKLDISGATKFSATVTQ